MKKLVNKIGIQFLTESNRIIFNKNLVDNGGCEYPSNPQCEKNRASLFKEYSVADSSITKMKLFNNPIIVELNWLPKNLNIRLVDSVEILKVSSFYEYSRKEDDVDDRKHYGRKIKHISLNSKNLNYISFWYLILNQDVVIPNTVESIDFRNIRINGKLIIPNTIKDISIINCKFTSIEFVGDFNNIEKYHLENIDCKNISGVEFLTIENDHINDIKFEKTIYIENFKCSTNDEVSQMLFRFNKTKLSGLLNIPFADKLNFQINEINFLVNDNNKLLIPTYKGYPVIINYWLNNHLKLNQSLNLFYNDETDQIQNHVSSYFAENVKLTKSLYDSLLKGIKKLFGDDYEKILSVSNLVEKEGLFIGSLIDFNHQFADELPKIDIENIDWDLLPHWCNQLVMNENNTWTMSSGDARSGLSMYPAKNGNNWCRYSTHVDFGNFEPYKCGFKINPVKDWQVAYHRDGFSTIKSSDFVYCIGAE